MTDSQIMSKAELLAKIDEGWKALQAFIHGLSEQQLTEPKDAAGWTIKDHLVHLAVWEDSINSTFDKRSLQEHMAVDEATAKSRDWDKLNGIVQQRYKDWSLADVLKMLNEVHQWMVARIESLPEADLALPFNHFRPDSTSTQPVIGNVTADTYEHYAEHVGWVAPLIKQES